MIRTLKKMFRGQTSQRIIYSLLQIFHLNNRFILFTAKKAIPNHVNLNYCYDFRNLGDNISPIIVDNVAKRLEIDTSVQINGTKHLYAIGSIITAGGQDCTVWGSGLLNTRILFRLRGRNIDFRAVRGPLSRIVLIDQGFDVPPIYGDPAILMPLFYNPDVEKKYKVSVITHMDEIIDTSHEDVHTISIATDDYISFINEVKSSQLIVSSSLHGIIFAETYGVKAIMLKPRTDLFKYYDYYYSTNRYNFPIVSSIKEALTIVPPALPDFEKMRSDLLMTFPADLWDSN